MAEAAKDQDQSMEDILQSIKRIIAEEGDPVPPPPPAEDVLELTDMLADDSAAKPAEEAPAADLSLEEIMAAPTTAATEPESVSLPDPEPPVITMSSPEPVAPPAPTMAPAPAPAPSALSEEGLMSEATRVASLAALAALNEATTVAPVAVGAPPTIAFRSGTTVEDLVRESLRPMLREWIDNHLPGIVETLVEREIRKLTRN